MVSVNETFTTSLSSSQPNPELLSPLDKFNLAIVKANSIPDENILPLGIAALQMANEHVTIDEIAMWIASKQKDVRDHPEYEANLIRTRQLLGLQSEAI
jgi:hypothetical protein